MARGICLSLMLAFLGLLLATPMEARVIGRTAEISIGRETASVIEEFLPCDRDPAAVARVRAIGRRLAAGAEDADFPFEFHVVEQPEVNAFALPGGFVYVFRGLLQLSPSDDALAFVLAHEISHVTRRHSIKQFEKSVVLNAGITAILAGTGGGRGIGRAADVASAVVSLGFTRSDEKDADDHGIALMHAAGYDVRAAVTAMELVKNASGKDTTPALLRSHPAPESRIKKLTELAAQLAKERQTQRPTSTLLPPPPAVRRRFAGLEGIPIEEALWSPLAADARWVYRVRQGDTTSSVVVRVIEELDASPEGVWRVETDLGRGVKARRLVVAAGGRIYSREDSSNDQAAWRLDASFSPEDTASRPLGVVCTGTEKVTTAAGTFEAQRVETRDESGAVKAVAWYAPEVGLVREELPGIGSVRELTSFNIPRAR